MKPIEKKISDSIINLINTWTSDIDGDIPVKFSDELSLGLFYSDLYKTINKFVIISKKRERHKLSKLKRYKYCKKNPNKNTLFEGIHYDR